MSDVPLVVLITPPPDLTNCYTKKPTIDIENNDVTTLSRHPAPSDVITIPRHPAPSDVTTISYHPSDVCPDHKVREQETEERTILRHPDVTSDVCLDQEETEPEADVMTRLTEEEASMEVTSAIDAMTYYPHGSPPDKPPPTSYPPVYNELSPTTYTPIYNSKGSPTYCPIYNKDPAFTRHDTGTSRHKLSRLSLPGARTKFRRLSDSLREFSPRSSLTSIWPDSPSSVTTLSGFISRDKHADQEVQTRQVLRLAGVLLISGVLLLLLETLSSIYTSASWVAGYSRCGISAGVLVSLTGILGILSSTHKDAPHKSLNFFKGLSLLSLLTGLIILCSTLANLDIRWINSVSSSMRASVFEVVLTACKVVVTAVTIATSLASIYV